MSDTKWRKLFVALQPCWGVGQSWWDENDITAKFIDSARPVPFGIPSLSTPWAYMDTRYGPLPLRTIEWLEFTAEISIPRPNNVPARVVRRDVEIVANVAEQLGCHVVPIEGGIRIMGYSR